MSDEGSSVNTNQKAVTSRLVFCTAACLFLLCLKGGTSVLTGSKGAWLPSNEFILIPILLWIGCIGLMLTLPRHLSNRRMGLLLLVSAIACRLFMLFHAPSNEIWAGQGVSNFPITAKLTVIFFDTGILFFLLKLLEHRCLSLRWAAIYAFNPIILFGFANQADPDAFLLFFMLAALCCYDARQWKRMFLLGGLAFHADYISAFILPLLISGKNIRHMWILILIMLLPFLPAAGNEPGKSFEIPACFGFDSTVFITSLNGLFRNNFINDPVALADRILLPLSILFGILYFHPERTNLYRNEPVSGIFFILGSLLILSPADNFQHLGRIIPFIALRPYASWIVLCITAGFALLNFGHTAGYGNLPARLKLLTWLPFQLLFIRDIYLFFVRCHGSVQPSFIETLSVVIPAKNESRHITACIKTIREDPAVTEIIVADGGSEDNTAALAVSAGAIIVHHPALPEKGGGRGGQIMAGLQKARGDLIAIVHADTLVPAPVFSHLVKLMNRQPMLAGGAVGSVFKGKKWYLRLLETANDFRVACMNISFGDQVQFFRRQPMAEQHLFPGIPLMEDVELSLRLSRLGRQTYLFGPASVSDRKWKSGASRRSLLILRLFWVYMWRRLWQKPDTMKMYRQYYGRRNHMNGKKK